MDPNDKRALRDRYERLQKKHHRSHTEEKRLREQAKARKAGRREPSPRRRADDEEDGDGFQKIQRVRTGGNAAPRGREASAVPPSPLDLPPTARTSRVLEVHRTRLVVDDLEGERFDVAPARGGEAAVVGDLVWIDGPEAGPGARVLALQPRRTRLSRPDPGAPERERVLAANVDLGLVVASLRRPALRPGLIDRLRVALVAGGVEPLVVLNKLDLVPAAERSELDAQVAVWRAEGLACVLLSAHTGEGVEDLRERLTGRACVLVGHSGVGKSTLLNVLCPGAEQSTGGGREFDGKGRHTTSSSSLWELEGGTLLIDTPGVREFGLWAVGRQALDGAFPELAALAGNCRFSDCRHGGEPGCALTAAVDAGRLPAERLESYRALLDELEER